MWSKFCDYKKKCDENTVVKTEFSQKLAEFITQTIPSPTTATVKGFCLDAGVSYQSYLDHYCKGDPAYAEVTAAIKEACEADAREKFEKGAIPASLGALWMGAYGYSTKQEQDIKGGVPVVITGEGDLKD